MNKEIFQRQLKKQLNRVKERIHKINQEEALLGETIWKTGGVGIYALEDGARAVRLAVKKESLHLLKATRETLQKMKQGSYGFCEECGKQIEIERLRLLPTTPFCVRCK